MISCDSAPVIRKLAVIAVLLIGISLPTASLRAQEVPSHAATEETLLDEMLNRWFGPLFASTTPTRYNARPKWLIEMRARNSVHKLKPQTGIGRDLIVLDGRDTFFQSSTFGFGADAATTTPRQSLLQKLWSAIHRMLKPLWTRL